MTTDKGDIRAACVCFTTGFAVSNSDRDFQFIDKTSLDKSRRDWMEREFRPLATAMLKQPVAQQSGVCNELFCVHFFEDTQLACIILPRLMHGSPHGHDSRRSVCIVAFLLDRLPLEHPELSDLLADLGKRAESVCTMLRDVPDAERTAMEDRLQKGQVIPREFSLGMNNTVAAPLRAGPLLSAKDPRNGVPFILRLPPARLGGVWPVCVTAGLTIAQGNCFQSLSPDVVVAEDYGTSICGYRLVVDPAVPVMHKWHPDGSKRARLRLRRRGALEIIPLSHRYGRKRIAVPSSTELPLESNVRLPRVLHARAVAGALLMLLWGLIYGILWHSGLTGVWKPLLPASLDCGRAAAIGVAACIAFLVPIGLIGVYVRRWRAFQPGVLLLPLGLYAWVASGIPDRAHVFSLWCIFSGVSCGAVQCMVPWPRSFYGSRGSIPGTVLQDGRTKCRETRNGPLQIKGRAPDRT